jgi:lysophospholipase L1-like esterase
LIFKHAEAFLSGMSGEWGNQLSSPPDVITVFFGANDAALPVPEGKHFHVSLPQYKANLHQIASHIKVKATPTHPSWPTSINCSSSVFHFSKKNWF